MLKDYQTTTKCDLRGVQMDKSAQNWADLVHLQPTRA